MDNILMKHSIWLNLGFNHNGGEIGDSRTTSRYYIVFDIKLPDDIIIKINKLDTYLDYQSGCLNYSEFLNHDIKLSTVTEAISLIQYHGGFLAGQNDIKTKLNELIKIKK